MIKIGVTGSIGMGKSTTARLFAEFGGAVHDADAAVARLYEVGGAGVQAVEKIAPGAVRNGAVDRDRLRAKVLQRPDLLTQLEGLIHPLVAQDRESFAAAQQRAGRGFVIYDIPLLYETGSEAACDIVVVASTSPQIQRERVLAREGMTSEAFEKILSRQTPDAEKRGRADYVVDTSIDIDDARRQVLDILRALELRFGVKLLSA